MNNFTSLQQVIREHKSDYVNTPMEHFHVGMRQLRDWRNEIKWAWQRVVRGYDDTELWSHHVVHTERMLKILDWYRHKSCGYPMIGEWDEKGEWETRWHAILDRMIAGFEAADMYKWELRYDDPDEEMWKQVMEDGLDLYIKYYLALWD